MKQLTYPRAFVLATGRGLLKYLRGGKKRGNTIDVVILSTKLGAFTDGRLGSEMPFFLRVFVGKTAIWRECAREIQSLARRRFMCRRCCKDRMQSRKIGRGTRQSRQDVSSRQREHFWT